MSTYEFTNEFEWLRIVTRSNTTMLHNLLHVQYEYVADVSPTECN
jgi:hypothetical protein